MSVSYIVINNGSNTEQYRLTNECNKPYMNVGNAKLPMMSASTTTTGLYVGGGNYRGLEYRTWTTSNTYYTTAAGSTGLTDTTALTRSSTSGESYLTRASTSGTNYGTGAVTTNPNISVRKSSTDQNGQAGYWIYACISTNYCTTYNSVAWYGTLGSFGGKWQRQGYADTYYSTRFIVVTANTTYTCTTMYNYGSVSATYNNGLLSVSFSARNVPPRGGNSTGVEWQFVTLPTITKTTGTTYLTRSSTSGTSYLTRSSTSGYSGKSSSSTISTSWA